MKLMRRYTKSLLLIAPALVLLQACSSNPYNIAPMPPVKYEKLGRVEGMGCGALGFLGTMTNFVPMGLNGRVEAAYQQALSKAPGATALINVEVKDDWAWALIVTSHCTTVSGDAIKELK